MEGQDRNIYMQIVDLSNNLIIILFDINEESQKSKFTHNIKDHIIFLPSSTQPLSSCSSFATLSCKTLNYVLYLKNISTSFSQSVAAAIQYYSTIMFICVSKQNLDRFNEARFKGESIFFRGPLLCEHLLLVINIKWSLLART